MSEQNFVEDTQDSTEDIQYQAYVALVEDFKEFTGPDKMHITLPDEYVEKYFKKV